MKSEHLEERSGHKGWKCYCESFMLCDQGEPVKETYLTLVIGLN